MLQRDAARDSAAPDISPRRALLVNALIATITLLYAYSIVFEVEAFPFSHFPMYSKSRAGLTESRRLAYVGIVSGREVEISRPQLQELASTRKKYLDRHVKRALKRPEQLRSVLARLTALAHVRGASLKDPLPPLDGMRLYEQTFAVDAWARGREAPARQELLFEFRRPGPQ